MGPANPAYVDGSRSQTNRLFDAIEGVNVGRDTCDLTPQIKSSIYREEELIRRLATREDSPALRSEVEHGVRGLEMALDNFQTAVNTNNADLLGRSVDGVTDVHVRLSEALGRLDFEGQQWSEIREVQEHKRRLVATKHRIDVQGRDAVRREYLDDLVEKLMGAFTDALEECIDDSTLRGDVAIRAAAGLSDRLGYPVPGARNGSMG